MNCPSCGNGVQADAVFCDQCGARLGQPQAAPAREVVPVATAAPPAEVALCPGCGVGNLPGELFCAECGTPLEAPVPLQAAPAAPVATATDAAPATAPVPTQAPAPAEPAIAPQAAVPEAPASCAACGVQVRAGDAFCFACGARLADQGAAAQAQAPVVAAQPALEAAAPATAVSAPAAGACPACGAAVQPSDLFCDACGSALVGAAATAAPQPVAQPVAAVLLGEQPLLVLVASGIEVPLPQGTEVLVGREDPYTSVFPDVDLTPYGGEDAGVSRRHFKLTLAEGRYAIQDLGSTNYTWLNQKRLDPQIPVVLKSGDEIRAGRLKLVFRTRS